MDILRKTACLLSLLVLFASCYNAERNCEDFRTGTFEFNYMLEGKEVKSRFVRNDSINIDYIGEHIDTASVSWVNDCEFIMRKLHPSSMRERKAVQVKILSTDENSYTFEYSIVGDNKNKQRGTAIKIE
ncbi:hypothetical protein [Sinomicrobium sp. M5D2P17]